jgi:hypothetical protein
MKRKGNGSGGRWLWGDLLIRKELWSELVPLYRQVTEVGESL